MAGEAAAAAPAAPAATPAPAAVPSGAAKVQRARPGELASLRSYEPVVSEPAADAEPAAEGVEAPAAAEEATPEPEAAAPEEFGEEPLEEEGQEPADPNAEPVLGMKPDELLATLRNGNLPKSIADQLFVDIPIGDGRTQRVAVSELPRGFMRGIDYTRKTEALAAERRQAQGILQARNNELQMLRDPSGRGMRQWIEDQGMFDAFFQAASSLAAEVDQYQRMTPEQQDAYDRMLAAQAHERKLEERQRQLDERERANTHERFRAKHQQDLQTLVPQSWARHNLQDSQLAQRIFNDSLLAIVNRIERFDGLSPEIVDEATRNTIETLQELRRYELPAGGGPATAAAAGTAPQQQQRQLPPSGRPQQRQPGPPPPTALPGAPRPAAQQRPNGQQRARISSFAQSMQKLNHRG